MSYVLSKQPGMTLCSADSSRVRRTLDSLAVGGHITSRQDAATVRVSVVSTAQELTLSSPLSCSQLYLPELAVDFF